ncbi:TetR family transcriptional regulator [Aureimonas endophytica]|uniref:TetR family transcriptional regulator n=1 Tax=Aureimonas endophytica TaxID=2027858 RepID=A0A916ZPE6_9HYPH|nr:TetR/AcrR family transcriptional regulator [Aureimonas endophytica]GGE06523.1 TetR family transcriptional regulator [Aureimonas endophytica]
MRKTPRQARSQATVAAILEAGTRILAEEGWSGFTTNKVAARAGVGIGSLYQYFPDKLSLVAAIRTHHLDECLAVMRRATAGGKPLDVFVGDLVAGLIAAHRRHPGLHRVLLDEAPNAEGFRNPNSEFEQDYLECYRSAVAPFRSAAAGGGAAALIVSDAIDGVIHNAARRGMLEAPDLQQELVRMITAYLAS